MASWVQLLEMQHIALALSVESSSPSEVHPCYPLSEYQATEHHSSYCHLIAIAVHLNLLQPIIIIMSVTYTKYCHQCTVV